MKPSDTPGIDVWFTKVNAPWTNVVPGSLTMWVNVYAVDGPVAIGVPAPDGHVSIDVPPGRYLVTGTTHGIYVNFDSNETIVNVGCGQRACVTIIPRSLHFCVWWLYFALDMIAQNRELAPEVHQHAPAALEALAPLLEAIPLEHNHLPFLREQNTVLYQTEGRAAD